MEITWYGHSCFRITERGMATVVTDPYLNSEIGYDPLKLKADIVSVSHDVSGHNNTDSVSGNDWIISGPGEYEIGGVFITAVPTRKNSGTKNLAIAFDFNGIKVAHLGSTKSVPTSKMVETFGTVDVLLLPVGGGEGLNANKAAEVVNLFSPSIVIPMHYKTPESSISLDEIDPFLKQMGLGNNTEDVPSLKFSKNDISEDTKVKVLSYKR